MIIGNFFKLIKDFFVDAIIPLIYFLLISIICSTIIVLFTSQDFNKILLVGFADLVVLIIMLPFYLKKVKDRNYEVKKFNIKYIKYLLGIGISLCLFFNLLLVLLNIIQKDEMAIEISNEIFELNIYVSLLIVSFVVPVCEELIFRGFIFKNVEYRTKNVLFASFVSSSLFAITHANLSQGIYAFFIGFMLCYVYNKFGGLKYSILLHLIMNFSSIFFSSLFSFDLVKRREQILVLIISLFLFIITMECIRLKFKKN